METPIIDIDHLWFSYNGQVVLREVNLEIFPGDFVALIGPNGGGKTTLLKLMLGLLKPQSGTIRIFGRPPRKASRQIGYVPQDVHINRSFPVTALDVVLMGLIHIDATAATAAAGGEAAGGEDQGEGLDELLALHGTAPCVSDRGARRRNWVGASATDVP